MNRSFSPRRNFLKKTALGVLGLSMIDVASARGVIANSSNDNKPLFYRYPAVDDESVSGIVGASHGNFDKVKLLVKQRPELASAAWDWGFGDFETAIGAASHVGRRDIAEFLIAHGAKPDIFTFTMLGMLDAVKSIIEAIPGIQANHGPHGITLLAHAKNRLSDKNLSAADIKNVSNVLHYLETLGNADTKAKNIDLSDEDKARYMGEYQFGTGDRDIFFVDMNSRKTLQVGRKGISGRTLNKIDDHTFSPTGAPSVKIVFKMKDGKATTFTVHDPEPVVSAVRI